MFFLCCISNEDDLITWLTMLLLMPTGNLVGKGPLEQEVVTTAAFSK